MSLTCDIPRVAPPAFPDPAFDVTSSEGEQTAVLGGLKTKSESETVTKLPLLGDIPAESPLGRAMVYPTATPTATRTPEVQP